MFVKFFMVFYDVTTKISGSLYVTSNSYFHELWGIQELLTQWSTNVNSVLSNMSSNMKVKYDKYWGSVERINKLIFIAAILDPLTN